MNGKESGSLLGDANPIFTERKKPDWGAGHPLSGKRCIGVHDLPFGTMDLRPVAPFFLALGLTIANASAGTGAPPKPSKGPGFSFSLLPKSFQKNPKLDFNILTEMTPEGRKRSTPTPQNPTYYISQAGGVYSGGVGAEHVSKTPPVEKLQQLMERALAEAGYLPAEGNSHPPTIAIIYHWGSHSFDPPKDVSDENGGDVPIPEEVLRKTLLDRAMLLGGVAFTKEVARAMEEADLKTALQTNSGAGGVGDLLPDPFQRLRMKSPEMDRLVTELYSSSYFVVATAYDYASLAKGQRVSLWRTKMTVNSIGVNMLESVPSLIATAAPYFGRDMTEPVVITKKISREGRVEVGTPTVVPETTPPAPGGTSPAR